MSVGGSMSNSPGVTISGDGALGAAGGPCACITRSRSKDGAHKQTQTQSSIHAVFLMPSSFLMHS